MNNAFGIPASSFPGPQEIVVDHAHGETVCSPTVGIASTNGRARRLVNDLEQSCGGLARLLAAFTSREISVVRGVTTGLTNKQIGAQLQVREETVKTYLKRIRLKIETAQGL